MKIHISNIKININRKIYIYNLIKKANIDKKIKIINLNIKIYL